MLGKKGSLGLEMPRGAARCTQKLGQPQGKEPAAHPGKGHFIIYFDSSLFSDAGGAGAEAGSCSGFLCPHPGATSPSPLAGSRFLFRGSLPAPWGVFLSSVSVFLVAPSL